MKPTLFRQASLALLALGISTACHAQIGQRQINRQGLDITVSYPSTAQAQTQRQGPVEQRVAMNGALAAAAQPRPLIVLSHGTAGNPIVDHALVSTLVRAGFVVAQPMHRGDNHKDFSQAGPASWQTRPAEVSETIDAVAADPQLGQQVNTRQVGVHGMSAGGVTALALAGAQWRMRDLVQHCAQHLDEDIGFCLNGLSQHPAKQQLRRAQFALARQTPATWLPEPMQKAHGGRDSPDPRPDPRIAVVSLLVPVGAIFTPDSLARIRIPVGVTVAEADEVLLPRFHSQHVLAHCSRCHLLTSHAAAGHFDWLAPWPADVARSVAATQMRGGLPHADFSDAQRQSGFDRIATFFVQQLQP